MAKTISKKFWSNKERKKKRRKMERRNQNWEVKLPQVLIVIFYFVLI